MSNLLQTDIYNILNKDHGSYLKPYQETGRYPAQEQICALETTKGCRDLVERIHKICNAYSKNCYQAQEDNKRRSAEIIQNFFLSVRNKSIFRHLKETVLALRRREPVSLLKLVNYAHSEIYDKNSYRLILRLDGTTFPPTIVYKFFPNYEKISLINLLSRKGNEARKGIYSQGKWYNFRVYKCNVCKTTVKIKPKTKIKPKKKRTGNSISWIQEKYG